MPAHSIKGALVTHVRPGSLAPINDGVIGLELAVQFDEPTGKWLAQYDEW